MADALTQLDAVAAVRNGTGPSTGPDAISFDAILGSGNIPSSANLTVTSLPRLKTLVTFTGTNGQYPRGSLIADAAGDLFGTTQAGGSKGYGTVFEIKKTARGYANAPITLATFTGVNGQYPLGSLIADAAGNLFGTTNGGGANNEGTVFEIKKTARGYANAPITLIAFTGVNGANPGGSLIADAAGNLFGTTYAGGETVYGTVFELAKTATGYASEPTTLVNFNFGNGADPEGSLIADAAGNLFGTTQRGGSNNVGTVFEIAKTASGYASEPTTLVNFSYDNGTGPLGSLIADAAGDLFGTTQLGSSNGNGVVFEIVKTASGYASAPITLASFDGANGANPFGGVIADAAGNLFGMTANGGSNDLGTVFEIAKTASGYADAPTTLVSFTDSGGQTPYGSLIADAAGNLFGTTDVDGSTGYGTVFEITNSGFVVPQTTAAAFAQAIASHGTSSASLTPSALLVSQNQAPTLIYTPRAG